MLAVLLAGICGISALSQNEFRYIRNDLQTDKCNVYYDMQYYTMEKARCTYYSFANDIRGNNIHDFESQNEIIDEVDDLIIEYTEKASYEPVYKDCIPLISQYTNCNRDNICTGCKTCNCDSEGRWNCSSIQRCRPDDMISLNHHTLVIVMEKLNDIKNALTNMRSKRSVLESKEKKMSPEEVLDWMYGVKRFNKDEDFVNTTTEVVSNPIQINNAFDNRNSFPLHWSNHNEKKYFNESEAQPLVFEDLLNNLNVNDDKNHNSLEDKTLYKNIIYEIEPPNALNKLTSSLLADTTILDDDYQTNKSDTDSIIEDVFAYIDSDTNENYNYKRDINYITQRLKKRDVALQTINVTSTSDNNTEKVKELKNIFIPLNNIVHHKQEELNKLINIRDKLITYTKSFSDININNSITNVSDENITHLYFIQLSSLQNLNDFRNHDQNTLNKYLQKFKRDVHEVVKDVAGIQRLSNGTTIPYDLKILIQAMKNYVTKEKRKKINNANNVNIIDLRKKFDTVISYKTDIKPIDEIIKIFEVLDNDMPTFNVLNSLTPDTRKILTRIIKIFYKNNTSTIDSLNKTYDLIKTLEGIGQNWNEMTTDIATNSFLERLYSMRLFYLVLSLDIKKIKDALAVLKFAENRRMTLINDVTGERLVDRIGNDLRKSMRKFNHIIQIQSQRSRVNNTVNKLSKKKSFLQHIKTLLKKSRIDIRKLFHRKVPKSKIVKHIAKKKMDEIRKKKLAEYEQTMQRWQSNLNIISRNKRAAGFFDNFINSIKRLFSVKRKTSKKKVNKTENFKKRFRKRDPKRAKKITSTTQKMKIINHKKISDNFSRLNMQN